MRLKKFIRGCLTSDLSFFLARRLHRQAFSGTKSPSFDLLKEEIIRRTDGEQRTLIIAEAKREVIDWMN